MISKIDSPAFYLILWMLLLAIVPQSHAQQPSVPPQEGDTLDNITISEAEARNIMKGLFDLPRLTHSLALGRIAKDERLTAFTDGFMQRNNIQVLTIGYIDSDEFWPRIFRQQRLGKINKADNDNLLAAKIIFVPVATEGPPTGYTTRLELTGKTSQVYELLSISQAEVDSIAASTSQQQLGSTTFSTPNEAKETVVSALIAALQRVELKASPQDALALVTFQAAPADDDGLPTYGFDQMVYEQLAADYPTATIAGQTVRTAWKSLKSNAPDKVTAVAAGDVTPVFQMDGVTITATPGNANTYKVSLMGASDGTASEVLALTSADNGLTMGLLNTISYDEEHTSVKIVPVNGAGGGITQAVLRDALNEIYASAIATWDVEVLPGVQLGMAWDEDGDGKLNDGETGMLSNYTGEMNALIAEFRKNHDRQKDAYYIFLVDKPKTPNKLGYMPRKKQWGFVFAGNHNNTEALIKTIAHELGHGVFHLEHTFSEKGLPQNQTTNLMDYTPTGTTLYKYQWDYVHDPVNVVTLFDDDEEGALVDDFESPNCLVLLDDSNYLIGIKQLTLSYKLNKWEQAINSNSLNPSNFNIVLFVMRNGQVVYATSQPLSAKGAINWHGLVFQGDSILTSKNKDQYKLFLGIAQQNRISETYKHWVIDFGARPMSTVLKSPSDVNGFITFVDLIREIPFEVETAWEDWKEVSDDVKKLTDGYGDYKKVEGLLRSESDGIGEVFSEIENPLQFLYDNSEEVEFLGNNIRVHWTFAKKLRSIEKNIADIKSSGRYVSGDIYGIGIRPQYGANKNTVSNHSYGLVVDIKSNHNHYIKNDQTELLFLIKHITNLDLFDRNARSPKTINEASVLFKQSTEGFRFDSLENIYSRVDGYLGISNSYKIQNLVERNPFEDFMKIKARVDLGIIDKTEISNYYVLLEGLEKIIYSETGMPDFGYLLFDEIAQQEFAEFSERVHFLKDHLSPMESSFADETITSVFSSIDNIRMPVVASMLEDYEEFREGIVMNFVPNGDLSNSVFKTFAGQLKSKAADKDFIKYIFVNGFCEVPVELIESFISEEDVQWGGLWDSANVDYMHFEIKKDAVSKYLNQKKVD
ncbi:MAG: hypothetical protein RIF36_09485 [Imperialibacter sp.]|uniref:hypothetical protein n=1 Tax=Imperialibacter sp. TaxID=2038411 RepID=UPI0032EE81E9